MQEETKQKTEEKRSIQYMRFYHWNYPDHDRLPMIRKGWDFVMTQLGYIFRGVSWIVTGEWMLVEDK